MWAHVPMTEANLREKTALSDFDSIGPNAAPLASTPLEHNAMCGHHRCRKRENFYIITNRVKSINNTLKYQYSILANL